MKFSCKIRNLQYQSKYNESITIVILTSFEGIVHSTGGQQILGWKTQQKHKYSIFCTDAPNKAKFFSEIFLFHSNLRKTNTSSFEKVVGFLALVYSYIKIHCTYKNPTSKTWIGALSQGILWNRQTAMLKHNASVIFPMLYGQRWSLLQTRSQTMKTV